MADELMPPAGKININKRTLKAGTPLYRIHREKYAGDAFNGSTEGDARFSPIRDQSNKVIATVYAGDNTKVALCEVPLHDLDFSLRHVGFNVGRLAGLVHTELIVKAELQLAVLDQPGLAKMRASKKVAHCDAVHYQVTRKWAEAIHAQHKEIQGMVWPSKQHPGNAYVLFGDRFNGNELSIAVNTVSVTDKSVLIHLFELADSMGITLLEGD
ncbi:RES family NAD+ phosphorylase [Serratia liquefaciens]|uniref:RES family NAD+ phosphorylase n=1 Tax=Serratia liquefaciens TaxID=614 RepID=UPI0005C83C7A|nr:RES family NAD+ phosphorylase [Serratia liquefaciens]GAK25646.1 transcriptional regulator [Serratia liquefaciens FK01]